MRITTFLALLIFSLSSVFADSKLTKEEMQMFSKNVVIPLPSEIIMSLDKLTETDWKSIIKYNYSSDYEENYKIAINLGVRVADGFMAIQAKDKKNIGEMFSVSKDLAENFGAKSSVFKDKDKILTLVDAEKWNELRSELDDLQLKIKDEMKKYHPDFVTLASLGGWIEGLHIVSKALNTNYDENASSILYQPRLIDHFISKLETLDKVNKNFEIINVLKQKLPVLKENTNVGLGNPIPKENIAKIAKISEELTTLIIKNVPKKKQNKEIEATDNQSTILAILAVSLLVVVVLFVTRKKH